MTTRGIRNHNPGNIERQKGVRWQGAAVKQTDKRFVVFTEPKWGIRAIARVLITYQDKRQAKDKSKIDTVREIIERWAPPAENKTAVYASHVSRLTNIGLDETLDVYEPETMRALVRAIIRHENGEDPYTDGQVEAGLVLAGIEPRRKSFGATRTVKGGTVAAFTGGVTAAAGVAAEVAPALPVLDWVRDNLALGLIVVGVVVIVAVGWMLWARLDDRNRGLR